MTVLKTSSIKTCLKESGLLYGRLLSRLMQNTPETSLEPSYKLILIQGTPPYLTAHV
jgi:hypothetical protein